MKVKEHVDTMNEDILKEKLQTRSGVFGYTPIHEAVMSKSTGVLRFLLGKAEELKVNVVNIKALNGYAPLHLATSQGDRDTVVALLYYGADIGVKDDYEKTPLHTAGLGRGNRVIVNILRTEGQFILTCEFLLFCLTRGMASYQQIQRKTALFHF